jgi:hypothetical protein
MASSEVEKLVSRMRYEFDPSYTKDWRALLRAAERIARQGGRIVANVDGGNTYELQAALTQYHRAKARLLGGER